MEHQDILHQYTNPEPIKRGGQKVVYKVDHDQHGTAALKIGYYDSPRTLERIRREVDTLRSINSEYYPKNYEFDVPDDHRFVILEEYIHARPLSNCLHEFAEPFEAVRLIKSIAVGLKVLWDRRIVHRDVKPDNILIQTDRQPKIIDLGIARLLELETLTTQRGAPLTKVYAAPEQLNPRLGIEINHRTDQFNLGIILVQLLLNGDHPFDPRVVGSGYGIPDNILTGNWHNSFFNGPKLSKLSVLASRLLGPQQYQRYRTPDSLLQELDTCIERLA